jgi:hypothetical protein
MPIVDSFEFGTNIVIAIKQLFKIKNKTDVIAGKHPCGKGKNYSDAEKRPSQPCLPSEGWGLGMREERINDGLPQRRV